MSSSYDELSGDNTDTNTTNKKYCSSNCRYYPKSVEEFNKNDRSDINIETESKSVYTLYTESLQTQFANSDLISEALKIDTSVKFVLVKVLGDIKKHYTTYYLYSLNKELVGVIISRIYKLYDRYDDEVEFNIVIDGNKIPFCAIGSNINRYVKIVLDSSDKSYKAIYSHVRMLYSTSRMKVTPDSKKRDTLDNMFHYTEEELKTAQKIKLVPKKDKLNINNIYKSDQYGVFTTPTYYGLIEYLLNLQNIQYYSIYSR